jgi:hypothetical protein
MWKNDTLDGQSRGDGHLQWIGGCLGASTMCRNGTDDGKAQVRMQWVDGNYQYRTTSLLFVTYGIRGVDFDNVALGKRHLENFPALRAAKVNQFLLGHSQCLHEFFACKRRHCIRLFDDETLSVDMKFHLGTLIEAHLPGNGTRNAKSEAIAPLENVL